MLIVNPSRQTRVNRTWVKSYYRKSYTKLNSDRSSSWHMQRYQSVLQERVLLCAPTKLIEMDLPSVASECRRHQTSSRREIHHPRISWNKSAGISIIDCSPMVNSPTESEHNAELQQ
jgi:hypothetical protein